MPIQTRCPSCAAAVPSSAAWCSLCHADLRPAGPAADVARSDVDLSDGGVNLAAEPTDEGLFEPVPAGRHAAHESEGTQRPRPSGGRHAAGRARSVIRAVPRPPSRSAEPVPVEFVLEGIELPEKGDVTPEQVDALAAQMLTRLAVTETRPTVLDPNDLPGGKWLFALGVMVAVVVVLLAVGTIVGLVVGR